MKTQFLATRLVPELTEIVSFGAECHAKLHVRRNGGKLKDRESVENAGKLRRRLTFVSN